MTTWTKRLGMLAGAALVTASLGTVYLHAQNTSGGAPPAFGRGGPGRPGPGGPGGFLNPRVMQRLGLTDGQREQVKAVMANHRDDMKALGERALPARRALQAAISADQFDESAIRTAAANVAAVEADRAVLEGRIHGELWQILTPEQQTRATALKAEMETRRADGPRGRDGRVGRRGPGAGQRR